MDDRAMAEAFARAVTAEANGDGPRARPIVLRPAPAEDADGAARRFSGPVDVAALTTVDACDSEIAALSHEIAAIVAQLEADRAGEHPRGKEWRGLARTALRYRKADRHGVLVHKTTLLRREAEERQAAAGGPTWAERQKRRLEHERACATKAARREAEERLKRDRAAFSAEAAKVLGENRGKRLALFVKLVGRRAPELAAAVWAEVDAAVPQEPYPWKRAAAEAAAGEVSPGTPR